MAIGDEVSADFEMLRTAALDQAADIDTRQRFLDVMSRRGVSSDQFIGGASDRDELLRTYRRRLRRAAVGSQPQPAGTEKLVEELERETAQEVVLFVIENDLEVMYVFARRDLRSLLGCVVGQRPSREAD